MAYSSNIAKKNQLNTGNVHAEINRPGERCRHRTIAARCRDVALSIVTLNPISTVHLMIIFNFSFSTYSSLLVLFHSLLSLSLPLARIFMLLFSAFDRPHLLSRKFYHKILHHLNHFVLFIYFLFVSQAAVYGSIVAFLLFQNRARDEQVSESDSDNFRKRSNF